MVGTLPYIKPTTTQHYSGREGEREKACGGLYFLALGLPRHNTAGGGRERERGKPVCVCVAVALWLYGFVTHI